MGNVINSCSCWSKCPVFLFNDTVGMTLDFDRGHCEELYKKGILEMLDFMLVNTMILQNMTCKVPGIIQDIQIGRLTGLNSQSIGLLTLKSKFYMESHTVKITS